MNLLETWEYIKWTEIYKNLFNIYEKFFKNRVWQILEEKDINIYLNLSDRVGNGITYDKFKNEVENLNIEVKKSILKYIIENWKFSTACKFSKDFGINTDYIEYDSFTKWFKESSDRIWNWVSQNEATEYIFLYKNPEELYTFVANEWYIEISYYIKEKYPNLTKFSETEMDSILASFKKRRKQWVIFFWLLVDYNLILKSISTNPEDDYKKVKNILKLSENEIEKWKELFKDNVFSNEDFTLYLKNEFEKSIEELIQSLKSLNLDLKKSFLLDNKDHFQNLYNFIDIELIKISIGNIVDTPIFSIYYDSLENKMKVLILQEKEIYVLKKGTSYIEIISDKNEYFNKVKEINNDFAANFKKFNIPYAFLLFKMKGWKNDFPLDNMVSWIEAINDPNYEQEYKRVS